MLSFYTMQKPLAPKKFLTELRSVRCSPQFCFVFVLTRKNFEQLFIPIQVIQGYYSMRTNHFKSVFNPVPEFRLGGGGVKNYSLTFFLNNSKFSPNFRLLKFSFTHFVAVLQNFRTWDEACRVWLKSLAGFSFFVSQPLNGSSF